MNVATLVLAAVTAGLMLGVGVALVVVLVKAASALRRLPGVGKAPGDHEE